VLLLFLLLLKEPKLLLFSFPSFSGRRLSLVFLLLPPRRFLLVKPPLVQVR
jgi:hypothetical protein